MSLGPGDWLEERFPPILVVAGCSGEGRLTTPNRTVIRSGNSRVKTQPRSRFGGAAAGVSGASDRIIRRPFGRSSTRLLKTIGDYRLEQISSSGIGQQAPPQALCFSL
jgi:hypothetical protein